MLKYYKKTYKWSFVIGIIFLIFGIVLLLDGNSDRLGVNETYYYIFGVGCIILSSNIIILGILTKLKYLESNNS